MKKIPPVSPGELLKEDFLDPMGISQYRLAKEIDVPAQRIGAIVSGKRSITADTDLRLCRFLGYQTATGFEPKLHTIPSWLKKSLRPHWRPLNPGSK